ncbi:MAG: helix-turn-helix transcriptional regulator [Clostridia bacterium]|nr:helix-turn-helix transcriptional regulator [Clostridia bacterium]
MINFKAIGMRIKNLRKDKSLTQEKLAEMLDISIEHLSRIENGSFRPSITLIEKISDIFCIDESELMFGSKTEINLNDSLYEKIAVLPENKKQAIINLIDLI